MEMIYFKDHDPTALLTSGYVHGVTEVA